LEKNYNYLLRLLAVLIHYVINIDAFCNSTSFLFDITMMKMRSFHHCLLRNVSSRGWFVAKKERATESTVLIFDKA